jgi:aspartate carbamoyltransferase catalytic subunit
MSAEWITTPRPAFGLHRRVTDPLPFIDLDRDCSGLDRLDGRSVVSVTDIAPDELRDLFTVAARLQTGIARPAAPMAGKVLVTAFFEPSTRTRLSFESAAHRLGASVMSVSGLKSTSVHKGESLADTGFMLGTYADVVVLRHVAASSAAEIRSGGMAAALINGGNGCDEHPTQAMADWYALVKWRPELAEANPPADRRIALCVLGTPSLMRSIRSFLRAAAAHFPNAVRELLVVSDDPEPVNPELADELARAGIAFRCTAGQADLSGYDVVYQNSLTLVGQDYEMLGSKMRLDADTPLHPDAVVMHPLARQDELGTDLDDTAHNLYFDQVQGAPFVRQALLLAVTGRLSRVLD